MKHPTKKGQWFTVPFWKSNVIITVKSFHGRTTIPYDTLKEAKERNGEDGRFYIKNKVYNDYTLVDDAKINIEMCKANKTL